MIWQVDEPMLWHKEIGYLTAVHSEHPSLEPTTGTSEREQSTSGSNPGGSLSGSLETPAESKVDQRKRL